jgi:hypothetical protein
MAGLDFLTTAPATRACTRIWAIDGCDRVVEVDQTETPFAQAAHFSSAAAARSFRGRGREALASPSRDVIRVVSYRRGDNLMPSKRKPMRQ